MATKKAKKKASKKVAKKAPKKNGRELHAKLTEVNEELIAVRKRENELDVKRNEIMRSFPKVKVGDYQMRFEIDRQGKAEISVGCVHIKEAHLHKVILPFVAANFGYKIEKIKAVGASKKKTKKK